MHTTLPPRRALFAAVLGTALAVAPSARAQDAHSALLDYVPADTYAVLQLAGLRHGKIEAAQHGLIRFYRQKLGDALEPVLRRQGGIDLEEMRDEGRRALERELGLERRDVAALLDGPMVLALGRVTLVHENPVPSMLLVADVGNGAPRIEALLQRGIRLLQNRVRGLRSDRVEVAGRSFRRLWHERAAGQIYASIEDGVLLVTLGRGMLDAALAAKAGTRPRARELPEWKRAAAQRQEIPLVQAHLDLRPLGKGLAPWLPYEVEPFAKLLGIEAVESLSLSSARAATHDVTWASIRAPGPTSGILKRALATPLELHSAPYVPDNALLYAAARIETKGLDELAMRIYDALPPVVRFQAERLWNARVEQRLRWLFQRIDQQAPGLPWNKIWSELRNIGPEFAVAVVPPRRGQLQPGALLFAQAADAKATAGQLASLIESLNLPKLRKIERHGTTLHYLSLTRLVGFPLTPCFAAVGNQLMIGSDRNAVLAWLKARENGARSILEQPQFAAQWKQNRGASMLSCLNLQALHTGLRVHGGPVLQGFTSQIGEDLTEALLSPELGAALGVQFDSFSADEQGFHWRRYSPIGLGSLLMVGSTGLDWFLTDTKIY